MTTKEFNEQARQALDDEEKYKKFVYTLIRQVQLQDEKYKNIYVFDLSRGRIKSESGKYYTMDKETKKMVRRILYQHNKSTIHAMIFCVCCFLGVCGLFVLNNQEKINKQYKEYKQSLPNWNDSIRLAKTDEELRHAMDKRDQQVLQLKHYKDSLRGKSPR